VYGGGIRASAEEPGEEPGADRGEILLWYELRAVEPPSDQRDRRVLRVNDPAVSVRPQSV
jgi:hypothetical protein